jgi:HK97 family phage prohead protease
MKNNDLLISCGDAIKTSADGRKISGYLVRFGSPDATDLDGEYFTANTDFGRPFEKGVAQPLNLYYSHGMNAAIGKRAIGSGSVKMDDIGLWYEAEIEEADAYAEMVAKLAAQNKLGYSSGAAAHLVERKTIGKSTLITRWPLAEASVTPTPAEYRNKVVAMKNMAYDMAADTAFSGIGQEITASGLQAMYYRLISAVYSCTIDNIDACDALINEFADLASAYVRAVSQAMTSEEKAEEAKSLKRILGERVRPESPRELERLLRDAGGLSRKEATAVASHGFKSLQRDADDGDGIKTTPAYADLQKELVARELEILSLGVGE